MSEIRPSTPPESSLHLRGVIENLARQFDKQSVELRRFLSTESRDLYEAIEAVVNHASVLDLPDEALYITSDGFDTTPPKHLAEVWQGQGYATDPEAVEK